MQRSSRPVRGTPAPPMVCVCVYALSLTHTHCFSLAPSLPPSLCVCFMFYLMRQQKRRDVCGWMITDPITRITDPITRITEQSQRSRKIPRLPGRAPKGSTPARCSKQGAQRARGGWWQQMPRRGPHVWPCLHGLQPACPPSLARL